MSDVTNASIILPPTLTDRPVTNTAISGSSTAEINTSSTGNWFTFTALTANVYIVFSVTGMTAATTSNGFIIPAGATVSFYVPSTNTYFRAIGDTTGTLSWYKSS